MIGTILGGVIAAGVLAQRAWRLGRRIALWGTAVLEALAGLGPRLRAIDTRIDELRGRVSAIERKCNEF